MDFSTLIDTIVSFIRYLPPVLTGTLSAGMILLAGVAVKRILF